MASTQTSLNVGRRVYKDVISRYALDEAVQYKPLFNEPTTTQTFEIFKQVSDLPMAEERAEGNNVPYVDRQEMYEGTFTPTLRILGVERTPQAVYTDQAGIFKDDLPELGRALARRLEADCALVFTNAFTTNGIDGDPLCSTSHSWGSGLASWTNRPSPDLALSSANIEIGMAERRAVESPRGNPMSLRSDAYLVTGSKLWMQSLTIANSSLVPENANNAVNTIKSYITPHVLDHLGGTVDDWFLVPKSKSENGLFVLHQIPVRVMRFEPNRDNLNDALVAYRSYVVGWKGAWGIWGTNAGT